MIEIILQQIVRLWIIKVNLQHSCSPKSMAGQPNDKQINHQQKYFVCNQCFFWIYQLIVLVLALLILGNFINAYKTGKNVIGSTNYQHSLETVWLWNQGYIIDIKAEKTNNCPEGYEPLITYKWPGSLKGCSCSSTSNGYSFSYVLQGQCNSQLISLGCNVVSALQSQTLNMWKGSSLLCYKRAPSMNFYNSILTTAPAGGSSSNMSQCAGNQTFQVYTLPGVACPITAASNSSLSSSQTTLNIDSKYGYNFNFINQTGYPIAAFKTSEYAFCDFFNTTNISPNKQGTYILQITNVANCPLKDTRMVQVDNVNEYDFYTNNTRVYQLIESLPAYPQPSSDYDYLLGYIPYPTWTFDCRNSKDYNLYQATDKILFKSPQNSLTISLIVILPCISLYIILFRLFYIIRHIVDLKSRKTYNALMLTEQQIVQQMPNLDIKKGFKKQCCLFVFQTIIVLGVAAGLVYSIINLTNESVWIKSITKLQCTDNYLQNIFFYYEQIIDQMSSLLIQCTFFWGFMLIIHFCYFITRNYIGDLFSKTEVVEQQKIEPIDNEKIVILDKEGALEGYNNVQDSSEIILQKEDSSELKVYDMDYLMGGAQTKQNFYGSISLDRQVSLSVAKKKKKKRPLNKKKTGTKQGGS